MAPIAAAATARTTLRRPLGVSYPFIELFLREHPAIAAEHLTTAQICAAMVRPESRGTGQAYLHQFLGQRDAQERLGEYNDLASRLTESLVAADAAAAADSEDGRAGHMAIAQRAVAKLVAAVDGAKPAADTLFAAVGLFEVAATKHSLTLKSAAEATEADTPAARSILEDASTAAVVRLDAMRTHADTADQ